LHSYLLNSLRRVSYIIMILFYKASRCGCFWKPTYFWGRNANAQFSLYFLHPTSYNNTWIAYQICNRIAHQIIWYVCTETGLKGSSGGFAKLPPGARFNRHICFETRFFLLYFLFDFNNVEYCVLVYILYCKIRIIFTIIISYYSYDS